jgi:crossover junction endodeoxyribonuclease RuvC
VGITAQQFEQMRQRASGRRRGTVPAPNGAANTPPAPAHRVILGVDPSLRGTGYGVIRLGQPQTTTLVMGTIACPADWEHSRCLVKISETLRDVVREFQPTVCIVEGLFFAQNLKTALIMGEARGAAMAAVAQGGLPVFEIAPRKVKQAIVGYGAAQKLAVAKMVQRLLGLAEMPAPDAADALALALTFARENGRLNLTPPRRV